MIASEVAAFVAHRVPSGTDCRQAPSCGRNPIQVTRPDPGWQVTLFKAIGSVFRVRSLEVPSAQGQASVAGAWHQGLRA
jgi:hypothetical protein